MSVSTRVFASLFRLAMAVLLPLPALAGVSWVHQGFEAFARGRFDDGGSNLYVNADGVMELIHRWDVNSDGAPDLFFANNHDNLERGPTRIYRITADRSLSREFIQLANDSGYSSRIIDLDEDGRNDLIVTNSFNGVNSELPCFVYWGEPGRLADTPVALPALGARDVAVLDVNRDGRLDLIFPSAWKDPHNPAVPMNAKVYLQRSDRGFDDASTTYGITCVGATTVAAADLNRDGFPDLVIGNSRTGHNPKTDSFIYWGTAEGFNVASPQKIPTKGVTHLTAADLDGDGYPELICNGGGLTIFRNRNGVISAEDTVTVPGSFCEVADVDLDGTPDLVTTTSTGVEIRSAQDLEHVRVVLPVKGAVRVTAHDLDGDRRPELVVSRCTGEGSFDTESPVFWNGPEGYAYERATWIATSGAWGNAAGDLDGDGQPELVFNNTAGGHAGEGVMSFVYLSDQTGTYSPERRLELPAAGSCVCNVADLNRDGYNDIAFSSMGMYPGGTGRFGGSQIF